MRGPRQAAHRLGIFTVFVGAGQVIGPVVAGVLADRSGSFDSSYLLAAILAVAGVLFLSRCGPRAGVTEQRNVTCSCREDSLIKLPSRIQSPQMWRWKLGLRTLSA
jgi:MFS family permease